MADAADLSATFEAAAMSALTGATVEHDALVSNGHGLGKDPIGNNPVLEAAGLGKVVRADANSIRVQGGEHVVVGGTAGNDTIITDFGDDGIWGDAGDDRIESGAGVDLVNGGAGNDIISDSGDTGDFLKGDEGDDVILGGNGLDIYMGGEGNDVVFHGVDSSETFAGQGNDFVLGGDAGDLIMGNEGDDWLEAGAGFDTTAGDNSELFFDSRIIGHDVMFSGSEEHDFDAESGDDIMVQGESVLRSEGMFGFDWATYKGNGQNADVDLARPIFTNEIQDVLRDRFDKVEAASGFTGNDLLVGDNRVYSPTAQANITATAEAVFFRDEINEAGIARIDGLDQIITNRETFDGIYTSEFGDLKPGAVAEKIFAGNVLIGGAGNDVLIGKGGNDILDGDRWLNVRIRITTPGAENTAENQIATIDSLTHVFTAQNAGNPSWVGKSLAQLLLDRVISPSQMHIVREILDGGQVGDVDTAVFWDVVENYTIEQDEDGAYVVTHNVVGNPAVLPPGFTTRVSDGVDTLRNIELVKFGDGLGGFRTHNIAQLVPVAATGTPVISDTTPTEGQVLSVNTASIQDLNGIASLAIQWQSSADGITWANIAGETGVNLTLPDAAGTALTPLHNQLLRSVVTVTDNLGTVQVINSAATDRVGMNFTAGAVATTFTAPATNDTLTGSAFADTLWGGPGNDVILGGDGNDILAGGQGNDIMDGQLGTDTALWGMTIDNFSSIAAGPGVGDISVQTPGPVGTVGAGGIDIVRNIEVLRFGAAAAATTVDYAVVIGTSTANNISGGDGSQAIFALGGNDTLSGNGGSDILVGGQGNDTVFGNGGDDWIFQTGAADGRDVINGGGGIDTYTLSGVTGAETFNIYARAAFLTANPGAALSGGTEIVITRNGTVIAELDNIEEIRVNGLLTTAQDGNGVVTGGVSDGDTVNVIGNFGDGLNLPTSLTSLLFNTIRFTGSNANDTVDITGLQSDHRIVFTTNGGQDTLLGSVRTQDVINGTVTDLRTAAGSDFGAPAAGSDFGAQDGLNAMVGGELRTAALLVGSGDSETSMDRTMIEMDQIFPLDTVETAPVAPVFVNDAPVDPGTGDQRSILTDYPVS